MLSKDDNYRKIFANNLNYYMKVNNKIQDDLVKDLGLKTSTISSWCNGQKLPRMDKIVLLADYFGIHFSKLIEERTDNNYFEFASEDDAMFPLLDVGDIALIYKQNNIEDGATLLINMNNHNTIRKFILSEDKTYYKLVAMNGYYKDIDLKITELNKIKVLGKVIKSENKSAFKN